MQNIQVNKPVRKVVRNRVGSKCGYFVSRKMGRMMGYESRLEKDHFASLEINSDVIAYCEQPRTFTYSLAGELHSYTPDVLVEFKGRKVFREVKPAKLMEKQANQVKYAAIKGQMDLLRLSFEVITDKEIYGSCPRLLGSYLQRFCDVDVSLDLETETHTLFATHGDLSVGQLKKILSPISPLYQACLALAYQGEFWARLMNGRMDVNSILLGPYP